MGLSVSVFLAYFLFSAAPPLAHAGGFFSIFEKFFSKGEVEEQSAPSNSQLIPLLKAALKPDTESGLGGGDISYVGQSALLAEVGPLGSIADIPDNLSPEQISIYVVQKGDNLVQIAKMFGVSVNTIIWANNLDRANLIREGQTLVILPVSGIQHAVKEGDTVESIAKKWKGDVGEIIQFNDLNINQKLAVGVIIIIPDGEAALPATVYSSGSAYRGGSGSVYAGYYIRPVAGGRKTQGLHGYNGVDLAVPCGSPIMASASGDVLISRTGGWNSGYGNFITINHSNGTQTLYAHNVSNIVGTGWHIVQGQVIGYVGTTGKSTGCHVHFEVRGAKNPW